MSAADVTLLVSILALGGFVQGLSGFGFALVTVPLCAMVVAPGQAVVTVALASTLSSVRNVLAARGHVDVPVARRMILAALAGMPLGLIVLVNVDDTVLRVAIGVVVAAAAVLIALGVELRRGTARTDVVTGFISGILNTSTSTNGPPLVIGLRAHRMSIVAFRGTMAAVFIVSSVVGIALFALRGLVGHDELLVAALALGPQLLTSWAGDHTGRGLGPHRFDRLVISLLFVSAVAAVISALAR